MRLGDIAVPAGFHGQGRAAKAAHRYHNSIRINGRSIDQRIEPAAGPVLLASQRIKAGHAHGKSHDQFILAIALDDDRCGPGTDPGRLIGRCFLLAGLAAGFVHLPNGLAGFFVYRDEELAFTRPKIQDAEIAMNDG